MKRLMRCNKSGEYERDRLAAARQFIKEGAKVIVTGRGTQSVGDAQKELGANGVAVAAMFTKSAEVDSLFQQVRET
jgi:NAD(P)-dependent dehydrogenase (short-subunit alcohol dehydrogenase family)